MRYGAIVAAVALAGMALGCGGADKNVVAPPSPAALRVTSVAPSTGSAAGNTSIQILGAGFVSGATLTLDGRGTVVNFVSSGQLRAVAPPHDPGPIDIVVTNPNGESSRFAGGFTYVERAVKLALTGDTSFESPGERSQLTVTATFADGRTLDVTRESRWSSTFPAVASVAADGMLTAGSIGGTRIFVSYPFTGAYLAQFADVTVTPAGTFALSGRVREPGAGGLNATTVVHIDSGQSARTDNGGNFFFGGLTGSARFSAARENYENAEAEGIPGDIVDIAMQRVIRLAGGAPFYTSTLAPNDLDYVIAGTHCQPCRMIRVSSPSGGAVKVTLTWTRAVDLHIWTEERRIDANGSAREVSAEIPVGSGESVIFIGQVRPSSVGDYVPFNLNAALPTGGVQ
jgi:IPT/TIG domain-containing protein